MNRDPLYRRIVEALEQPLDGNAFQACAVALLGKVYPNLTPLPGGDDAGMDGAFGTDEGPYPLVCTVQENVIGNFRNNSSTYLAKRRGPKLAVVATSQRLTNRQKRNLEEQANALGVTIVNIHDRTYFANQLYRDPRWRLELLGIPDDLPPLSILPRVGRFAPPDILVGRKGDLEWLKSVHADLLLVGQPGSGKTYLHQYLAQEGLCLFAVDDTLSRLADAVREQQPEIIVVDDAHFDLELVKALKRLRVELGSQFRLHLNCWPGYEQSVQRALDTPEDKVRHLPQLRRQDIFALIQHVGIHGPDWLQHLIIAQSDGKPGLAVALAEVCKTDNVAQVWSGEAAARRLLGDLRLVRSEKERCVLAAFAVGGDAGMAFENVSTALGIPLVELRQIIVGLSAGGLVEAVGPDGLQVRPPAIRPVLVRDTFYGGLAPLPIEPFLRAIPSPASTATVLFSARQRGAKIDTRLLEAIGTAGGDWAHFAWIDPECAEVVLDKHPEDAIFAIPGLLKHSPRRALDFVLDAADGTQDSLQQDIRRQIAEWLFPFDARQDRTVERRGVLLDILEARVRRGAVCTGGAFAWAAAELLQFTFDILRQSPGDRHVAISTRGMASLGVLRQIAAFWPRVRELVRWIPIEHMKTFIARLEQWCFRRFPVAPAEPDETFKFVQNMGRQMLLDMLNMPQCNRAMRTQLARIARLAEFDVAIQVDALFDALYGERGVAEDWEAQKQARISQLRAIVDDLLQRPMDDVLQLLADIRSEAEKSGFAKPDGYLRVIYYDIANKCTNPSQSDPGLRSFGKSCRPATAPGWITRASICSTKRSTGTHKGASRRLFRRLSGGADVLPSGASSLACDSHGALRLSSLHLRYSRSTICRAGASSTSVSNTTFTLCIRSCTNSRSPWSLRSRDTS